MTGSIWICSSSRQPKETIIRSRTAAAYQPFQIKDASDTNTDFDDIDGAIRSGYFLKEGLANNEDFYYLNLLITITAPTRKTWNGRSAK